MYICAQARAPVRTYGGIKGIRVPGYVCTVHIVRECRCVQHLWQMSGQHYRHCLWVRVYVHVPALLYDLTYIVHLCISTPCACLQEHVYPLRRHT